MEKIDSAYADAVKNGLCWLYIPIWAFEKFKDFGTLLQAAANATAQVAAGEHDVQVLRRIITASDCELRGEDFELPDGKPCQVLSEVKSGAEGVILMSVKDAETIAISASNISSNALGIVTLGRLSSPALRHRTVLDVECPALHLPTKSWILLRGSLIPLGDMHIGV